MLLWCNVFISLNSCLVFVVDRLVVGLLRISNDGCLVSVWVKVMCCWLVSDSDVSGVVRLMLSLICLVSECVVVCCVVGGVCYGDVGLYSWFSSRLLVIDSVGMMVLVIDWCMVVMLSCLVMCGDVG